MSKKILIGLFAVVMCFALVGCGKEETNNGSSTRGKTETNKIQCDATESDDSFVDKYEYAEEYMIPSKGVYTGYVDQSGYFYFEVDCITKEDFEEYTDVLLANGFVYENASYKNKEINVKIVISNRISTINFISVYVYPSLNM